ncbi:DUF6383 domain-containing protein [uncultured Parabacteroides sp.]|uniref:DUF6383 domain-containing protein n=1 Tax=uncultured Parabacteroides sp. TaxID=512312 RepID=UPI00260A1FC9|nr:DUF6383 domain-containing protein [uncultured Parabacteroides sp.]
MNKRFSTLLAAALVAGGLSSTVMATADATPDKDKYYRLETGSGNTVLGVDAIHTDSLVLAATASSLDDRFFWTITKENTATATPVYKLVNKETKAVLSLAIPSKTTETSKTGNVAAARIKANGVLNQWVNSQAAAWGTAGKFTAYKDGKEYGLVTVTNLWGGAVTSAVVAVAQLNGSGAVVTAETGATVLELKLVDDNDPVDLTAKDLNAKKNTKGFDLTFTPNSDDNIFSGKTLQALSVKATNSITYARDNSDNTAIANLTIATTTTGDIAFDGTDATNKIVFLATGKTVTNGAKQKVKYFTVVDTAYIAGTTQFAFTEDTIGISADGMSLVPAKGRDLASYMFSVSYNYSKGNVDIYPVAVPTAPATDQYWGDVEKKGTYAANISPANTALAVNTAADGYLAFINVLKDAKALTLGDKATVEGLEAYKNMSITFGSSTAVKNLDTKVAYFVKEMDEDNKATSNYWVAGDAKSASASAYVPSTQWNLVSNGGTSYKLVNRESGNELTGANGTAYDVDAANGVYMIGSKTVTLVKCPEATGNYVGYKKFTASQVDNLTFAIQVQALSNDPVYLTTKDSAIVATVDADKKVMFRLKPNKEMKFGDTENDSLKRTSYMLLSADKKSYLAYDKALNSYKMTSVAWENANATNATAVLTTSETDTAFVYFQAVGKDKYSLVMEKIYTPTTDLTGAITVNGAYSTSFTMASGIKAGVRTQSGLYDQKVSVNITDGAVSQTEYDNAASNTVFMIEDGTPDYDKTIQKPAHQTITLSTDNAMALTITSDNFAALKRVGQELKADYTIDNLKMYVDTATMADVNKPLYYIATGQNISDDCKAKGEMNYLVSFEDSVKIDGYTSETLPRVGFLEGVVEADTITLFNGHAIADKDTVVIKKNHRNIANWAFTANENGSISLENQKSNKFIAVRNDVLVMVPSINEAAQFNMAATEAPTANEGVAVSEVTVIAGEGQVTIANAAGKKVVISNILGQTVANTVLTTDNAVIAAPAGVVVVAVEGEAAVKAIVK